MKTFRRYLLSYVCMLLIPITLLSAVFFALTGRNYADQVSMINAGALGHVSKSLELQTTQLDACAYQTVQYSAFSTAKLESDDYSAHFSLREYLTNWSLTNAFVKDLYYTSSDARYYYSGSARYTPESFVKYQLNDVISADELSARIVSGHGRSWLALGGQDSPVLLYIAAARYSSSSMHYLIARIDYDQISALVRDASAYADGCSYVCDPDGGALLALGEGADRYREVLGAICAGNEDWGKIRFAGDDLLFARVSGKGLVFIDLSPRAVAYANYYRMVGMYLGGIAFIILLGGVLGQYFMNVNYAPLRQIGELSSRIVPGAVDNGDMVQGAIKTLNILQESRYEMLDKSVVLLREKLVMRLLMGGYATSDAFNAEGADADLSMEGGKWALLRAEDVDFSNDGEETVIAAVSRLYGPDSARMRLFMPENSSILFILPAPDGDVRMAALREALARASLRTAVSRPCDTPAQLAAAFLEMNRGPSPADELRAQLEALRTAVDFEEPERVHFSLNTIRRALAESGRVEDGRGACFEVLRAAHALFTAGGYGDAAAAVRDELTAMLYEERPDLDELFRRLEELFLSCAGEEARRQRKPLVNEMLAYMEKNCCSESFSIQDMADHFGLTLSNLSHYFKKYEDISISDWVKRRRVEVAQELLAITGLSVTEVSTRVGYWQPGSFTRAFKSVTGVTPAQFRKNSGRDEP